ncbi:MAG: sulfurtransferase TusA family protein [Bacillaceae bacterium]|nr:sulfurtransferase TusA family protein [Bacillaceae bacterium]
MSHAISFDADETLDCIGAGCPMPVVRTKKTMEDMEPGQVLEVQATDRGSLADLKAWSDRAGQQYLGHVEEDGIIKHYIRKSDGGAERHETRHPHVISNEELERKLDDPEVQIVDVREPAEYAFGHIPGARSIPLGELEEKISEIDPGKEVYVVCQTGNRSDLACQILTEKGFDKTFNVTPGMSKWKGKINKIES